MSTPAGRAHLGAAWAELRSPTPAVLELWHNGRCRQRLPLGEGRVRIGRDPGCELPVEAAGVSRIHAVV
ncbi:MAG: FHA domain-containing protein, partial [Cyanobacteriota bacterium]